MGSNPNACTPSPVRRPDLFEIEALLIKTSRRLGGLCEWGARYTGDAARRFEREFPGRDVHSLTVAELVNFMETELAAEEGETRRDAEAMAAYFRAEAKK